MANETKLVYELSAEISKLTRGLNKAENRLQKSQRQTSMISSKIQTGIAAAFSVAAIRQFSRQLIRTTEDYDAQAKAIAQVEQGIISTGAAAGKTLQELRKQAEELQSKTLFGDEEILGQATAQLLTFTNVAENNFDRLQRATLDIATRTQQDLKSTSIQLGKALNDPIANLGALGRTGIQFSKDQKQVIKELANTNRLAEAQALILDELEAQYGGSAEAAAQAGTGGWKQLSNTFGDLREQIGEFIAENSASRGLAGWLKEIAQNMHDTTRALNSNLTGWQKFQMVASQVFGNVIPSAGVYGDVLKNVGNALKDQEEQIESNETAQKAAAEARRKEVAAIQAQIQALKNLKAEQSNIPQIQSIGAGTELQTADVGTPSLSHDYYAAVKEKMQEDQEAFRAFAQSQADELNMIINNTIGNALFSAFDGLGRGSGVKEIFASILSVMGEGMQQLGGAVLGIGVALEAVKKSLSSLNPVAAIAAGGALIAAGAALKSVAGSFASRIGGGAGSGGGPSGSFQNSIQGQSALSFPKEIKLVARGNDLVGVLNVTNRQNSRNRAS